MRSKLFSLQLVCVSAIDKCLTASSSMPLPKRFKLFSLQLVCVSAVAKCLTALSVMLLCPRFNLFSSQNPDCVRCQVTTSQSQYILATEGC